MSWIKLDQLKRFLSDLKSNNLTFTGAVNFNGTTKYKGNEVATKADIKSGGSSVTVDSELSSTSENPVQNKVINSALEKKAPLTFGGVTLQHNSFDNGLELSASNDVYCFPLKIYSSASFDKGTASFAGATVKLIGNHRDRLYLSSGGYGLTSNCTGLGIQHDDLDTINKNTKAYELTFENDQLNYRDSSGAKPLATQEYVNNAIAAIADYDSTAF